MKTKTELLKVFFGCLGLGTIAICLLLMLGGCSNQIEYTLLKKECIKTYPELPGRNNAVAFYSREMGYKVLFCSKGEYDAYQIGDVYEFGFKNIVIAKEVESDYTSDGFYYILLFKQEQLFEPVHYRIMSVDKNLYEVAKENEKRILFIPANRY